MLFFQTLADVPHPFSTLSLAPASASASLTRVVLPSIQDKASNAFILPPRKVFTTQYRSIYHQRLFALRPHLLSAVRAALLSEGGAAPAVHERIVDAHPGVECVVVGTLYKDMPLKPTILDEYEDNPEEVVAATAARSNFCGSDDALVLEDDHGRISLNLSQNPTVFTGAAPPASAAGAEAVLPAFCTVSGLVSGLVVAVQGKESETGEFTVSRVFFPDLVPLPSVSAGMSQPPIGTTLLCASAPAAAAAAEASAAASAAVSDADSSGASSSTAAAAAAGAASGSAMADTDSPVPPPSSSSAAVGIALPRPAAAAGDTFVAFLSDLRLGGSEAPSTTSAGAGAAGGAVAEGSGNGDGSGAQGSSSRSATEIAMLVDLVSDFLLGLCSGSDTTDTAAGGAASGAAATAGAPAAAASRISHLVIAGGAFPPKPPALREDSLYLSADAAAAAAARARARVSASITALDLFATRLAAAMPVTVVPGAGDPSNAALPQQPLHPCLFASAATYSSFQSVSNPAVITLPRPATCKGEESKGAAASKGGESKGGQDELVLLGTGGQNITDMLRFSSLTPLSALALCFRSRLIAPTAPDTLPCYPYAEADPFVIVPGAAAAAASAGTATGSTGAAAGKSEGKKKDGNNSTQTGDDVSNGHVQVPDVLFAGCQKAAGAAIVTTPTVAAAATPDIFSGGKGAQRGSERKETLLLAVPSFAETGQLVLVNTRTLAPTVVTFAGIGF